MSAAADDVLAEQAWDLYCRGGELAGIAQALHVEPRKVAEWFAGREPSPEERREARHLENLRVQLRQLHASEPRAAPGGRAAILAQIGRVESAIDEAEQRRPAFRPGSARGRDWHDMAPPIWRDAKRILRATKSRGLGQCRYVDQVALRTVNSPAGDIGPTVRWLRERAVRDCPGCPAMRFERRCEACGRFTNAEHCAMHPHAPTSPVPQPFKWCLTVGQIEVENAMREQRAGLPAEYKSPAPGYSTLLADGGLPWIDHAQELMHLFVGTKRDLQRHEAAIADGSRDTPAWRAEIRELRREARNTLVDIHRVLYENGVAEGRLRPMVNALNQTNVYNDNRTLALAGDAEDRLMAALRADPKKIPAAREALAALAALQDPERKQEVAVDVVAREAEEHRGDRKGGAARRPRARGGHEPAGRAPRGVAADARGAPGARRAASA